MTTACKVRRDYISRQGIDDWGLLHKGKQCADMASAEMAGGEQGQGREGCRAGQAAAGGQGGGAAAAGRQGAGATAGQAAAGTGVLAALRPLPQSACTGLCSLHA